MTTRFDLGGGSTGFVESSQAVPLVSIVVGFPTGGVVDPPGKDGLTRLTARVLRRGAGGMCGDDIENLIDTLGGELGFDVGLSCMTLHAQVIRRNLDPFIELLTKIFGKPDFPEAEVAQLRRESMAEIVDARDNDRSLANVAFRRALFGSHPYGRGAVGRLSTLETVTRDDVISCFRAQFVREGAVIGFAGALTEIEAQRYGARIADALSSAPRTPFALPEPTATPGRRLFFVDKPERTQTQLFIGSLGTWPHDDDHVALIAGTSVFGGTFTSRMMHEIRSKRGWSYGTSARLSIERRRHAYTMAAFPAAADAAPCLALMFELFEKLVAEGITPDELSFIRDYLVLSHAFEVDTAPKRLGHAVDTALFGFPPDYHTAYLDRVKAVTHEAANAAIRKRLTVDDLVVVVVGTASGILEPIRAAVPRLAQHEVLAYDRD